jgi:formylglycine-generating enzyme required for sulfatase activity
MGEYAWYSEVSGDQSLLPVGRLKPNDAGLFDMYGNIHEWCHDRALLYAKDREQVRDIGSADKLVNNNYRMSRGGSFFLDAPFARSAYGLGKRPGDRNDTLGFRPARTFTP